MKRIVLLFLLASCGTPETHRIVRNNPSDKDKINELEKKVLALQGTQAELDALIKSDFATCPLSGDTENQLINTMCKVAQYANSELRVELKGQLASYSEILSLQINGVNDSLAEAIAKEETDITAINDTLSTIDDTISTINDDISSLAGRISSVEDALDTLNTLVNGAIGSINGAMVTVDIGIENLSAGPTYESILRTTDKSKINAYVEAMNNPISLGNNPMTVVKDSYTVKITMNLHALVTGDTIYITGATGSKGLTNVDVNGFFVVDLVVDDNNFNITVNKMASSAGSIGKELIKVRKLTGRGLATIWKTADGADVAVRTTGYGGKKYNFIIKSTGFLCYDRVNNAATYATIVANGTSIVCK